MKLPAVDPKNDASRYDGSKSSASTSTVPVSVCSVEKTVSVLTESIITSPETILHHDVYFGQ